MTTRFSMRNLLLATLLVVAPSGLAAQEGTATQESLPDGSETELVFDREVFAYPDYGRRNPFKALVSGDDNGPRFEDIRLLGVIVSSDPRSSVALFGVSEPGGGRTGPVVKTYRARLGDRLGNTRLLDIERRKVTVEVEEFGLTEKRSLEVKRPGEGGSQ